MLGNSLGSNLHMWDKVASCFESRYRVLRYDMRGHGESSVPPGRTPSMNWGATCFFCWIRLGRARGFLRTFAWRHGCHVAWALCAEAGEAAGFGEHRCAHRYPGDVGRKNCDGEEIGYGAADGYHADTMVYLSVSRGTCG